MPAMDEPYAVFGPAQRFNKPVDPITGQTENSVDTPIDQNLNDMVANRISHDHLRPPSVQLSKWLTPPGKLRSETLTRSEYFGLR
jgi:hypothetical protein